MSGVHHEEIVTPGVVHVMDSSSHQNCKHLQFSEHLLQGEGGEEGRRGGEGRREERRGGREEGRRGRREERRGRREEERYLNTNAQSVASFPGLPCFSSSVCVQYNTWKQKSAKNGEGLGSFIT